MMTSAPTTESITGIPSLPPDVLRVLFNGGRYLTLLDQLLCRLACKEFARLIQLVPAHPKLARYVRNIYTATLVEQMPGLHQSEVALFLLILEASNPKHPYTQVREWLIQKQWSSNLYVRPLMQNFWAWEWAVDECPDSCHAMVCHLIRDNWHRRGTLLNQGAKADYCIDNLVMSVAIKDDASALRLLCDWDCYISRDVLLRAIAHQNAVKCLQFIVTRWVLLQTELAAMAAGAATRNAFGVFMWIHHRDPLPSTDMHKYLLDSCSDICDGPSVALWILRTYSDDDAVMCRVFEEVVQSLRRTAWPRFARALEVHPTCLRLLLAEQNGDWIWIAVTDARHLQAARWLWPRLAPPAWALVLMHNHWPEAVAEAGAEG
jgi:hypothetical protein